MRPATASCTMKSARWRAVHEYCDPNFDCVPKTRSPLMQKTLDRKLAAIHADPHGARDFIIADAKDADMAFGLRATGQIYDGNGKPTRFRTLAEYREEMRSIVKQGLVDIVLMSNSTNEQLTLRERLFDRSAVT